MKLPFRIIGITLLIGLSFIAGTFYDDLSNFWRKPVVVHITNESEQPLKSIVISYSGYKTKGTIEVEPEKKPELPQQQPAYRYGIGYETEPKPTASIPKPSIPSGSLVILNDGGRIAAIDKELNLYNAADPKIIGSVKGEANFAQKAAEVIKAVFG